MVLVSLYLHLLRGCLLLSLLQDTEDIHAVHNCTTLDEILYIAPSMIVKLIFMFKKNIQIAVNSICFTFTNIG